jgi:hypothetical protein
MSHAAPASVLATSRDVQRIPAPLCLARFWPLDEPGNRWHRLLPATETAALSGAEQ